VWRTYGNKFGVKLLLSRELAIAAVAETLGVQAADVERLTDASDSAELGRLVKERVGALGRKGLEPLTPCAEPEWAEIAVSAPDEARITRQRMLERSAADRVLVLGTHFPTHPAGTLVSDGDAWRFIPRPGRDDRAAPR
jgi:hypothetical protein